MASKEDMALVAAMSRAEGKGGGGTVVEEPPAGTPEPDYVTAGRPIAQAVKPMVLPAVGALAGSLGGPVTAAAGAGAGVLANQAAGISEPMTWPGTDKPAPLGAPAMEFVQTLLGAKLAGPVNQVIGAVLRRAPGAMPVMHEMSEESLKKIAARFQPPVPSEQLYAVVAQSNPRIAMANTRRVAQEVLDKESLAAAGLTMPGVTKTASSMAPVTAADFQAIRVNLRRVGDKIRETREVGGEEHGAWKALRKAMLDDLEDAAAKGQPGANVVTALKEANAAFKREMVADEIAEIASVKGGGISIRADLGAMGSGEPQVAVNMNKIIKDIQKSRDVQASLTADEYRDLVRDLSTIAKDLRALPAVAGVDAGSKNINRRLAVTTGASTAGGAVAIKLGMDPTTAAVLGGTGLVVMAKAPEVIGKALASPTGRLLLRHAMLDGGGLISPRALAMLAAAVGGSGPGQAMQQGAVNLTGGLLGEMNQ